MNPTSRAVGTRLADSAGLREGEFDVDSNNGWDVDSISDPNEGFKPATERKKKP
jgi:hypothetical protein